MTDIEQYKPLSFLEGQETLLGMYNEGIILVDETLKDLTTEEKDAITQSVLKQQILQNKEEKELDETETKIANIVEKITL